MGNANWLTARNYEDEAMRMTYRSYHGFEETDPLGEVATILARGLIRYQQAEICCSPPRTRLVTAQENFLDDALSSQKKPCSVYTRVKSTSLEQGADTCR